MDNKLEYTKVIPKNTILTCCPNCNIRICETSKDVIWNTVVSPNTYIKWSKKQKILNLIYEYN